jgi:hypothetical protein
MPFMSATIFFFNAGSIFPIAFSASATPVTSILTLAKSSGTAGLFFRDFSDCDQVTVFEVDIRGPPSGS